MNDQEIEQFYKDLQEFYGDRLANFEHYPRLFSYQVQLFKYFKKPIDTNIVTV